VSGIEFHGLEKTQISYIELFLKIKEGDRVTINDIESDVQQLKNIIGIGDAVYLIDTIGGQIVITYDIQEIRTLLPILNFGGIKDNLWFQLGLSDNNWRGKGQQIVASYFNNDGLSGGQLFFKSPRTRNSRDWGYTTSLSRWVSLEPLFFDQGTVNYIYENNSAGLTAIKNFGNHHSIEFGGTYFIEKYRKSDEQFFEDPPGPEALTQPKLLSKMEYKVNRLNYDFFYNSGYLWTLTYQNVFTITDNTLFNSLQYQAIGYLRPTEKINLGFRLKLGVSTNNDSPFAPFVADSHVNLRGVGNRIDRGTAQAVLNVEYRNTVFHHKTWSSQVVIFSDLGTWRSPGGDLQDLVNPDQFRHFIGGGFRIIYQKVFGAVLRVDYGIDVFNPSQKGLVLGLGQYF
jgi:outer membrane protein assembly factor BamA